MYQKKKKKKEWVQRTSGAPPPFKNDILNAGASFPNTLAPFAEFIVKVFFL